jgi:hypothetical protein
MNPENCRGRTCISCQVERTGLWGDMYGRMGALKCKSKCARVQEDRLVSVICFGTEDRLCNDDKAVWSSFFELGVLSARTLHGAECPRPNLLLLTRNAFTRCWILVSKMLSLDPKHHLD